jgi:ABC-type uncharacterized transport system ATPase subunit
VVRFRGKPITNSDPHAIARLGVGIKTQVPSVFDGLSVRENIWISASRVRSAKRAKALTDDILEQVALTDIVASLVGRLSHGQRQWVEIGMVLAGEPELILLDEPAAGMTSEEVSRTAALIRTINRARAIVVVEHDMKFISMIAKRVTVFHQGQILIEDTVERVLSNETVRDVYLGKRRTH